MRLDELLALAFDDGGTRRGSPQTPPGRNDQRTSPARKIQTVLLGGAAGTFLSPSELSVKLTFEDTRAIGATLGSGVVMVFDDQTHVPSILRRIAAFFRDESCGQCVPCRVGTVRQEELMARVAAQRPLGSAEQEARLLAELGQAMRDASICGLGQTASSAIESAARKLPLFHGHKQGISS